MSIVLHGHDRRYGNVSYPRSAAARSIDLRLTQSGAILGKFQGGSFPALVAVCIWAEFSPTYQTLITPR